MKYIIIIIIIIISIEVELEESSTMSLLMSKLCLVTPHDSEIYCNNSFTSFISKPDLTLIAGPENPLPGFTQKYCLVHQAENTEHPCYKPF